MGLTQEQWYQKLRSWVPTWVFESERKNVAIFQGYAKVFSETEQVLEDFVTETFIMQSDGYFLSMHGSEREVDQLPGESEASYALRVQRLRASVQPSALLSLVNSLLVIGPAMIHESITDAAYLSRGNFLNRYEYLDQYRYDSFLIIVPPQEHLPYSFASRGNFASRSDFIGSLESSEQVYASIIAAVNAAKAYGVLYRIVEKTH